MTFSHQVAVEVSLQVVVEAEVELLAAEALAFEGALAFEEAAATFLANLAAFRLAGTLLALPDLAMATRLAPALVFEETLAAAGYSLSAAVRASLARLEMRKGLFFCSSVSIPL